MCTRRNKEKGFTLVELSIVLIIIGLIVSGVLVGQDLINAARLRSTIQQLEGYQTAVNTFTLKFDALAGDADATDAIPNASAAGDGDGLLDDTDDDGTQDARNGELVVFWESLSEHGMIAGSFDGSGVTEVPAAKINGFWGVYGDAAGTNFFHLGVSSAGAYASVLNPLQARDIDNKLDNGLAASGIVRAPDGTASNNISTLATFLAAQMNDAADNSECVVTATLVYDVTNSEDVACQLRIEMN